MDPNGNTEIYHGEIKVDYEKPPIDPDELQEVKIVADFEIQGKTGINYPEQQYQPPNVPFKGKRKYESLASTQTGLSDDQKFPSFTYNPDSIGQISSKVNSTAGTDDGELDKDGFPDVHTLLNNCESYMKWVHNQNQTQDKFLKYIQLTEGKFIFPNEKFEKEETLKWNIFEHISYLGAVCYFFIELNKFPEAKIYVGKARDALTAEKGSIPKDYVSSFDYIWDYLCLYGSVKEWEYSGYMNLFPEMNLLTLTLKFSDLKPEVKAGVYCVKQYFYSLIKVSTEHQIKILRQAITLDPQYFEWFLCLQEVLRYQRIKYQHYHHIYPWDAEIQAMWTATLLAPTNPRVLSSGIQLLAEICKTQLNEPRWTIIRYGDICFHGLLDVKSYMKEQAEKIIKLAPKSVRINCKLASIFTTILPYGHRDFRLGKECLERCLKFNPESCKANHRMAEFFLTVDTNYRRAEMYYELALDLNEKSYSSLAGIIQIMLRTATHRKIELMSLIETQLSVQFWDSKQIGGLYYFKGLALCANSNSREAVTCFIQAYTIHEKSLSFQDLPAQHRRFGWGAWTTSKLSFNSIRLDLQKEKVRADPERKKMISLIVKQLNTADATDKQFQASRQEWRR